MQVERQGAEWMDEREKEKQERAAVDRDRLILAVVR